MAFGRWAGGRRWRHRRKNPKRNPLAPTPSKPIPAPTRRPAPLKAKRQRIGHERRASCRESDERRRQPPLTRRLLKEKTIMKFTEVDNPR
ncbi:hypothetical protein Mapa_018345 [Marchantia paleacea]|nr:hypothetical protein Mapa_018345 [Marchantia paleacea]